jgi:hypothetical protein
MVAILKNLLSTPLSSKISVKAATAPLLRPRRVRIKTKENQPDAQPVVSGLQRCIAWALGAAELEYIDPVNADELIEH